MQPHTLSKSCAATNNLGCLLQLAYGVTEAEGMPASQELEMLSEGRQQLSRPQEVSFDLEHLRSRLQRSRETAARSQSAHLHNKRRCFSAASLQVRCWLCFLHCPLQLLSRLGAGLLSALSSAGQVLACFLHCPLQRLCRSGFALSSALSSAASLQVSFCLVLCMVLRSFSAGQVLPCFLHCPLQLLCRSAFDLLSAVSSAASLQVRFCLVFCTKAR